MEPEVSVPAPLPPGAIPLRTDNNNLPDIYAIPGHSQVREPHGQIYLVVYDWRKEAMDAMFRASASAKPPSSGTDALEREFLILKPSSDHRVVLRAKYGSGLESDDKVGSWSHTSDDLPQGLRSELTDLTDRILGPMDDLGPNKSYVTPMSTWTDGTLFERSPRAICLRNAPRCYSVALVTQTTRRMSAPGAHGKVFDLIKDEEGLMRFDLIKYGSENAMLGMEKGPADLVDMLKTHADLINLPRVGHDGNVAHPQFQLNIATAVEPTEDSAPHLSQITDLGTKFGGSHIDFDSPGAPTAMLNLSPPYEDVEEQFFYMLELGLGWQLEPLSTLYFSGLHFHGGCQPRYKKDRTDKNKICYRLTLIAYPPEDIMHGNDATAFATLPNGTQLNHGFEFRDGNSLKFNRVQCEQATYTGDGSSVLEPISYLRHWSNTVLEMVIGIMHQMDPTLLPRIDSDRFLSSISAVIDGERVRAPSWDLAPGWEGRDVEIGTRYADILTSSFGVSSVHELTQQNPEALVQLWNSDDYTTPHLFNKPRLMDARKKWDNHIGRQEASIPICVVVDKDDVLGGRMASKRKGVYKSARNGGSTGKKRQREEEGDAEGRSRKKQHVSQTKDPFKPFMLDLTLQSLKTILAEAKQVLPLGLSAPDVAQLSSSLQELCETPVTGAILTRAQSFSSKYEASRFDLLQSRSQHLLIDFLLWHWLDGQVTGSSPSSSIGRLCGIIVKALKSSPVRNQKIDAADYFEGLTLGTMTHLLNLPHRANFTTHKRLFQKFGTCHWSAGSCSGMTR